MYHCLSCESGFKTPILLYEKHNLKDPPYERIYVCPICKSTDYEKMYSSHCHCCGAKLTNGKKDYCSDTCKIKGEKLWLKEFKRKKLLYDSDLYSIVRETEAYNKNHNTKYSYGQYVALIKSKKKVKKSAKRKKEIS